MYDQRCRCQQHKAKKIPDLQIYCPALFPDTNCAVTVVRSHSTVAIAAPDTLKIPANTVVSVVKPTLEKSYHILRGTATIACRWPTAAAEKQAWPSCGLHWKSSKRESWILTSYQRSFSSRPSLTSPPPPSRSTPVPFPP